MLCTHCNKSNAVYSHNSKKQDKILYICETCVKKRPKKARFYELQRLDKQPISEKKFHFYKRYGRTIYKKTMRCETINLLNPCYTDIIKLCESCLSWVCKYHKNKNHKKCSICRKCFPKLGKCMRCLKAVCVLCKDEGICKKCILQPLKYFMSPRRYWIKSAKATGIFDANICRIIAPLLFKGGIKTKPTYYWVNEEYVSDNDLFIEEWTTDDELIETETPPPSPPPQPQRVIVLDPSPVLFIPPDPPSPKQDNSYIFTHNNYDKKTNMLAEEYLDRL